VSSQRPLEVEAKARAEDLNAVETTLVAMGAVLDAHKLERDEYFAHPARDFAATDEALRLRVTSAEDGGGWSRAELTYKGAKVDQSTKTRPEENIDIQVDQVEGVRWVLEQLGFTPVARLVKHRREFVVEGLTVCLDDVEGVGRFVEVEVLSSDVEVARGRVLALFHRLGLKPDVRASYLEMHLAGQKGL
jgi:adenylate cyclase class 2